MTDELLQFALKMYLHIQKIHAASSNHTHFQCHECFHDNAQCDIIVQGERLGLRVV